MEPFGFPFWGGFFRPKECGYPHLGVRCDDGFTATLVINGIEYILLDVVPEDKKMGVRRKDYDKGICPKSFLNTSLDLNHFQYGPQTENLAVLYGCKPPKKRLLSQFRGKIEGVAYDTGYYLEGIVNPTEHQCNTSVVIQGFSLPQILFIGLREVIQFGFDLNYTLFNDDEVFCKNFEGESSNGTCGFDNRRNKTVCVCPYGRSEDTVCKYNLPSNSTTEGLCLYLFIN
ncbi:LEAF RUST 10 DISEASE-RESISTANCE LOCUS RECEPTOR-LIKE PROTEIN KINASE-like 1.4 [Silene latifolia]|uniref:LEAF RUST 10 DISEASE-RESISTANCE LOCUS RECEPTOR-LIKE PROTEIN KINASE-like 1.4 n=1 Tax=Silene latifolia TaxID=37657 RepID=UPI003D776A68